MKNSRDSERTRARILNAAALVFSERGFDGARMSEIARRAQVSKQLVHHHFRRKEKLFIEVHSTKFWPKSQWQETLPRVPADMFADRFLKRVKDANYVRFITWEAASGARPLPAEEDRRERIKQFGSVIRVMQHHHLLPNDMDYRLIHLAILSLATYPVAFSQITRIVTDRESTDPRFQREWAKFLRKLGGRLFGKKQ